MNNPQSNRQTTSGDSVTLSDIHKRHEMHLKANLYRQRLRACSLYHSVVLPLSRDYGLTEGDVAHAFFYYNNEINHYDNSIYESTEARFALLLNYLLPGTWFAERLRMYAGIASQFSSITDIGFGFPLLLLSHVQSWRGRVSRLPMRLHLIDKFPSAFEFADRFISHIRNACQESSLLGLKITYDQFDLDSPESEKPVDFQGELVVALDCIEHARDPLAASRRIAAHSSGRMALIGLPIGPIIPQHTAEYLSVGSAVDFVGKSGFTPLGAELVTTDWRRDLVGNPDFSGSVFIEAAP